MAQHRLSFLPPNTLSSTYITNHDPDTASSDRPIPAAASRLRIAMHVLSAQNNRTMDDFYAKLRGCGTASKV